MNELIVTSDNRLAVKNEAELWAKSKTNADSERFLDMVRDKTNAVVDFYQVTGTAPQTATPKDVERWQDDKRERELATSASYASRWLEWLAKIPVTCRRSRRCWETRTFKQLAFTCARLK